MPPIQSPFVSTALARLRRGVAACCWVVAGALLVQVLVWCTATFTQARIAVIEAPAKPGVIISAHDDVTPATFKPASPTALTADAATPDPNRVMSQYDPMLAKASTLARATGSLAMVMLLPLLGLGVLLGVTTATSGVESTVSAFMWSLFISMLVLPLGASVGLPWSEGALTSYTMMTEQVDAIRDASPDALGGATFYARFAFLPIACVAGIAMVGLRFGSGVNAGIIPRESMRLDPVLEREAANVKPGSLHGGRPGNALRNMNGSNTPERKPSAPAPALATSAGEAPRRLI